MISGWVVAAVIAVFCILLIPVGIAAVIWSMTRGKDPEPESAIEAAPVRRSPHAEAMAEVVIAIEEQEHREAKKNRLAKISETAQSLHKGDM
jgi:lysylphosphatidylglycerol synthetase-like protein (DUF2156 family)